MGDAFKALADPTRRRILELLAQGNLTAGEIAAQFDMTKPSVSHHLNILKAADLVSDEPDRVSGIDEMVLRLWFRKRRNRR